MKEYEFGRLVLSLAGHDKGRVFVILAVEAEYVILADGKYRTVEKPKRKKKKHVQYVAYRCDRLIEEKQKSGKITNEMVKYELKKFRNGGIYV